MTSILGIYAIPAIKQQFIIVPSLDFFSNSSRREIETEERMKYLVHILQSKDRICTKVNSHWQTKIVPLEHFLKAILQHTPREKVLPNRSCDYPEELELIAINLLKNPQSFVENELHTPKVLSVIPAEDIIEVFI